MIPLVLDFDGSMREWSGAQILPLGDWQENIRFGCGWRSWRRLRQTLTVQMPPKHGTVLIGSGDFHHVSHLLIERIASATPIDVVVCDNHPDNMWFPIGIHCGSWVRHVAALPQVRRVHVIGITSGDVGWQHALENHLGLLYSGKVNYWTVGVDTRWAQVAGLERSIMSYAGRVDLLAGVVDMLRCNTNPAYLSIDKDVLAPTVVHTNWDQGCLQVDDLQHIITALSGRLIGSDITGEISAYVYNTAWKRWLSGLDEQRKLAEDEVLAGRDAHATVNRCLLDSIAVATRIHVAAPL